MKAKKIKKRNISPDLVYNNLLVAKFVNQIMKKGKKSLARSIIYGAFDKIKEKTKKEPLEVFNEAIRNTGPLLEVRSTRVGGATYQVPREVKKGRRTALAMRWIIAAARSKKGKSMQDRLAEELTLAAQNQGEAIRKKVNIHRMAEANRAFAHFAR